MNISVLAQGPSYHLVKDEKTGDMVYCGQVSFGQLNNDPALTWLPAGYEEYTPDERSVSYLRDHLGAYSMVVFLGTWCSDSHFMIPKLEKVLRMANYPSGSLTMYGVNRDKQTGTGEDETYHIVNVPTIILFRDGNEAGRIVESVQASVEADLCKLISH